MLLFYIQIKTFLPTVQSGTYEISATNKDGPFSASKLYARCDMDSDNGGWTTIQRRVVNGKTNFYRNWDDYELGFGNLEEEFWLGLQNIHRLTTRDGVELRIDLQDEHGNNVTWTYQEFRLDGSADKYRLHIGQAEGPPEVFDAMAHHNNRPFSTYDRDNDEHATNCAERYRNAWWNGGCLNANLNGPHVTPPSAPDPPPTRIVLYDGSGRWIYYPNVEMKVRPIDCQVKNQC